VGLLSSRFKAHKGSPQNTGRTAKEILAQLEADRKDGSKVVEESILSCIDDLGRGTGGELKRWSSLRLNSGCLGNCFEIFM
jgi:hypothetical protein